MFKSRLQTYNCCKKMKVIIAPIVFLCLPLYSSLAQINSIATVYGSSYGLFITDNPQKADIALQSIIVELLPENCSAHIKCSYLVSSDSIPAKTEMGISFMPDKMRYSNGKVIRMRKQMILDNLKVSINRNELSDKDISISKEYLMGYNEIESLQATIDSLYEESRNTTVSYNQNFDTSNNKETIDSIGLKLSDMIDTTPYVTWDCVLDKHEVKNVDIQWTTPFGIEISNESGGRNLFFISFNLPDNTHWNGLSDSTYFEIHWNRFSDMVIDKAIPGNYTMNDKLMRWNVKELDLKGAKNVKILFHSSDTIPDRILRSHDFPGFGYDPIPSVPQKLYLPSL